MLEILFRFHSLWPSNWDKFVVFLVELKFGRGSNSIEFNSFVIIFLMKKLFENIELTD